jgi:hypothetical protein
MGWGDELMAAGEAMAMGGVVAIKDRNGNHRYHPAWENNPFIAKPGDKYTRFIVNAPGYRPYFTAVNQSAWTWRSYRPKPAKMFFSDDELAFAGMIENNFVVVEPNLKHKVESVNRDWGWDNFARVTKEVDADWVQFGATKPKLLPNARWIQTPSPRHMAAALAKSKAFLAPEGGLHHTAAALNLKGVVLFGGFIAPQVTGYKMHKNIFIGDGLGCGKRVKCEHCEQAWSKIDPERIIKIMRGMANG